MTSWRINAVRIPLNEDCWLGINGLPPRYSGARYRMAIRAYAERLHQAGLYVILDLHWNAPGQARATGQQPMADLDHSVAFWSSVARVFKADPAVAFDLYNEPYGISWKCWRDGCILPAGWRTAGMQALVDAVRSTGAGPSSRPDLPGEMTSPPGSTVPAPRSSTPACGGTTHVQLQQLRHGRLLEQRHRTCRSQCAGDHH
jgi:Cellulase (glycosyl hydrolase family 5)